MQPLPPEAQQSASTSRLREQIAAEQGLPKASYGNVLLRRLSPFHSISAAERQAINAVNARPEGVGIGEAYQGFYQGQADRQAQEQEIAFQRQVEQERLANERRRVELAERRAEQAAAAGGSDSFYAPLTRRDPETGDLVDIQYSKSGDIRETRSGYDPVNTSAIGKADAKYLEDARDRYEASTTRFNTASEVFSLLQDPPPGAAFGPAAKTRLNFDKARIASGDDSPELLRRVAFGERLVSLENEQFVANSGPLKGALSNQEGERITRIGAGLGDSYEGAVFKAAALRLQAQLAMEREQFVTEAVRERGLSPEAARRAWASQSNREQQVDALIREFTGADDTVDLRESPTKREALSELDELDRILGINQ